MEKFSVEKLSEMGVQEICNRLDDYRQKLIKFDEFHTTQSKHPNASPVGQAYESGCANGLISARAILEDLFDF